MGSPVAVTHDAGVGAPDKQRTIEAKAPFNVYFASLYFVSVGVLYLWGYWSSFGVNILQYMSLGDALKIAAYPIASAFIFVAVGAVIGEVFGIRLPPGGGRDTPVGRALLRLKRPLALAYVLGTSALAVFGPVRKWIVLPILLAFPVYLALKPSRFLNPLLLNDSARSVVIFLLAVLPMSSYGYGRLETAYVLEGTVYKYVLSESVEGLGLPPTATSKGRIKYLGQAGDYVFLLLPDNKTLALIRFDKTRGLLLGRFPEK